MWVKNTAGIPDAMLTFALFSFIVVTLNVFLSTFGSFSLGDMSITFHTLDSSVMAVYLGATFTAYVSRRWTDKKYEVNVSTADATAAYPTYAAYPAYPVPYQPGFQPGFQQNYQQPMQTQESRTLDSSIRIPNQGETP